MRFHFPAFCRGCIASGSLVVLLAGVRLNAAIGRIPTLDDEVVAVVRSGRNSSAEREWAGLRQALAQTPNDSFQAATVARRCLDRARQESDPRWLGQALLALKPWEQDAAPPIEVQLVRAILRQRLHEFELALDDLKAVVARDPRCAEGWLVKSTVHGVRGEYADARRAAAALWRLTDPLTAATASATVASLTGGGERSCQLLERVLGTSESAPVASKVWAHTQLAEAWERLGNARRAEDHFREGLKLDPREIYLLGSYSDFLMQEGRAAEVISLLSDHGTIDGLLLRWVEAKSKTGSTDEGFRSAVQRLQSGFDLQHARGERVHLREEARFQLNVRKDPQSALALARENWTVQREPADVRLLLEAARAGGSASVESQVWDWVASIHFEDVRLGPRPVEFAR
jgi:tetratricopeptide (TPR) repeat protein